MSEWEERPLGDLLEVLIDHRGKTPKKLGGSDFTSTGVRVVSAIHIKGGRIDWSERERYVPQWLFEKWMPTRLCRDDVLLTSEAPIGEVAQVPNDDDLVLSQRLFALRGKPDLLDSTFLRYFLQSSRGQERLLARASGTTVVGIRQAELTKVDVPVPPLDEQRRIAAVLRAFDHLIDSNRVLAAQSHDAAQAIGLMMLRRFADRPDAPLPTVAAISKGFSYKSAELVPGADTLVNLKNFGRGGVFQHRGFKPLTSSRFKPGQVVNPGDVVISMTDLTQQREVIARPLRVPNVRVAGKMVASLDLAIARPLGGHTREFLAAVLSQESFHSFARNYCNGTTVLHMSIKAFEDYTVPRITPEEAAPFVSRIRVLNDAEDSYRAEAGDLVRTRDELLPLLMSGRVRVGHLEGVV